MIEPLTIEAAKLQAAKELNFPAKFLLPAKEGFVSKPTILTDVVDRAMEIYSESQVQCKLVEIEQALPNDGKVMKRLDLLSRQSNRIPYLQGLEWMKKEVLTLLKHNTP